MNSIEETLEAYADRAGESPADLLDIVERRYSARRRRVRIRRMISTGAAAVLVMTGVCVGSGGRIPGPVGPGSTIGPYAAGGYWHLPSPAQLADLPSAQVAFRSSMLHLPAGAASLGELKEAHVVDSTNLLIMTGAVIMLANTTTQHLTTLVRLPVTTPYAGPANLTVSAHWIVWMTTNDAVYKAPLSGGSPTLVASLSPTIVKSNTDVYATDDALYWTSNDDTVMKLSLSGGVATPVPGFEHMRINGDSPWAAEVTYEGDPYWGMRQLDANNGSAVVHRLKNLLTGAARDVAVPDVSLVSLNCTLSYCLGVTGTYRDRQYNTKTGAFIQDLDGSHRQALPAGEHDYDLAAGVIVDYQNCSVFDPRTGAVGSYLIPGMNTTDPWYQGTGAFWWGPNSDPYQYVMRLPG